MTNTASSLEAGTNADSNAAATAEFPTGSSVPFPYETPYPQQTALMDTLLQCLKRHQEEIDKEAAAHEEKDTTVISKKRPRRAAVMMLESPTGTGKSLSLACSAMAWLKYCEQRDLEAMAKESKETNSATKPAADSDDWWNAWVPPETTQRQQELQKSHQTAVQARHELCTELDLWRSKLYGDQPTEERAQQRRENMVRSAVTTAKMAEKSMMRGNKKQHRKKFKTENTSHSQTQEDFCLPDYSSDIDKPSVNKDVYDDSDSDDDIQRKPAKASLNGKTNAKPATQILDGYRLDGSFRSKNNKPTAPSPHTIGNTMTPGNGVRKIVYAARTHSQLSQFVGELKRTAWGNEARVVALGSRQLLCGNHALKKYHPTESSLTEACLDLKQGTTSSTKSPAGTVQPKKRTSTHSTQKSKSGGCPLLDSKEAVATLGLHLLTTPSDIEDAARLGSASRTCAYYASRKALVAAEVVVLPYSMLLSKPTRQAIGLSLEGALVLVDEAHNLPEALRGLHSSQLSLPVIQAATQQLTRYTQTYAQRLAGRNLMYLGNLRKLLQAFAKYLKAGDKPSVIDKENANNSQKAGISSSKTRTLQSTGEFLLDLKLDNINLFKLLRYLEHSRLPQKLLGFARAKNGEEEAETTSDAGLSKHVSAMSIVQTFLEKLNLKGQEGKVVTDWPTGKPSSTGSSRTQQPTLRYVLLNPASCFDNVLEEAHALALVGGTLAPFGHVAAELLASDNDIKRCTVEKGRSFLQLASQADSNFQSRASCGVSDESSMAYVSSQFAAFTCDHVVPPSNVKVKCLSFGPGNTEKFDFRHQSRMAPALCQELGEALLRLSQVVPHGLVVFLPSYSYEAHLVSQWQASGLWKKLDSQKKIFREPKSAQHLEATLRIYAVAASGTSDSSENSSASSARKGGALLLAVIGGKMSEGINLANDMARGVVVVGLPYPDITDPILKEKMTTMTKHGVGGLSGQAYYQNLCMRAVNQSVGRAIRHANDYAAIFLCDYRYAAQQNIWMGLPKWLRNAAGGSPSRQGQQQYPSLEQDLHSFFHQKGNKA